MKRGEWVFDGINQLGKIKNGPYEVLGVLLIDIVLYGRNGDRLGRTSPAEGEPAGYEPACAASHWVVIEKPDFPLSRFQHMAEQVTTVVVAGDAQQQGGRADDR